MLGRRSSSTAGPFGGGRRAEGVRRHDDGLVAEHLDSRRHPPTTDRGCQWTASRAKLRDFNVVMFARLRPDVSASPGGGKARGDRPAGARRAPTHRKQWVEGAKLDPLSGVPAAMHRSVAAFMSMLMLTGVLVLLIAVANVAGMLLARGAYRRREIAMRLALGASRGRLLRQLLTESVILCTLGACGGLLLARWLLGLIPAALPPAPVKLAPGFTIDHMVLGVTLLVVVVSGVLAGLQPALQSLRTDLVGELHGSAQGHPVRTSRMRDAFVVGQLALSLVLLITAGLFTRALQRAMNIDPGFDAKQVVTARLEVSNQGYSHERGAAFYAELLTRLRARPEIAGATLGEWTPLGTNYNGEGIYLPGEEAPNGKMLSLTYGVVDAGYLEMMRIPVVAGRPFSAVDAPDALPVVIVNETFARRYWRGENPIGREVSIAGALREVVGVVKDGKYRSLDESPENYAFLPYAQRYNSGRRPVRAGARRQRCSRRCAATRGCGAGSARCARVAGAACEPDRGLFVAATSGGRDRRRVRCRRTAAGDRRHIWNRLLSRRPAHARVRDPARAGCESRDAGRARSPARSAVDRHLGGGGNGARDWRYDTGAPIPLRARRDGSADLRRGAGGSRRHRGVRELHSRAPRGAGGSDGGVAGGVEVGERSPGRRIRRTPISAAR